MSKEQSDLARLEASTSQASETIADSVVNDADRVSNLARVNKLVPPRRVDLGEDDPFGLLSQEDTYERMAGLLFNECEGLYRQLASSRPEIGKQVRLVLRDRQDSVTLPTAELMDIYKYALVRTEDSASTHYLFHRIDKGYEDKGFRIKKADEDDHVVINNLDINEDYTKDDEEYFKLLTLARNWIRDYALQMNVNPDGLRALANAELKPYSLASRIKRIGSNALRSVSDFTRPARHAVTEVATVKTHLGGRRPRIATLAVLAACVPVSSGTLGTEVGGSVVNWAKEATKSGPGFDSHHYHLPATSAIPVGALNHRVDFDPTLSDKIYYGAPLADGKVSLAQVRRIDPIIPYDANKDSGLPGIGAANCLTLPMKWPGIKYLRIVSTNPVINNNLKVSTTNQSISVCNETHHVMHEANTHIFIEPEG